MFSLTIIIVTQYCVLYVASFGHSNFQVVLSSREKIKLNRIYAAGHGNPWLTKVLSTIWKAYFYPFPQTFINFVLCARVHTCLVWKHCISSRLNLQPQSYSYLIAKMICGKSKYFWIVEVIKINTFQSLCIQGIYILECALQSTWAH